MVALLVVILIWYALGLIGAFLVGKLPDDLTKLTTTDCLLIAVGGVAILGFGIGELFYYILNRKNLKR